MSDICRDCIHSGDLGGCLHRAKAALTQEYGQNVSGSLIKCSGFRKNGKEPQVAKESADPNHYKHGSWEAINVIKDVLREAKHDDPFVGYCHGQVLRYMLRLGRKDGSKVEAEKAKVYFTWMLENME